MMVCLAQSHRRNQYPCVCVCVCVCVCQPPKCVIAEHRLIKFHRFKEKSGLIPPVWNSKPSQQKERGKACVCERERKRFVLCMVGDCSRPLSSDGIQRPGAWCCGAFLKVIISFREILLKLFQNKSVLRADNVVKAVKFSSLLVSLARCGYLQPAPCLVISSLAWHCSS